MTMTYNIVHKVIKPARDIKNGFCFFDFFTLFSLYLFNTFFVCFSFDNILSSEKIFMKNIFD